jgi:hypothetical protein
MVLCAPEANEGELDAGVYACARQNQDGVMHGLAFCFQKISKKRYVDEGMFAESS